MDAEAVDAEAADLEAADLEAADLEAAAGAEAAMSSELMDAEVTLKSRREEIEQNYMRDEHAYVPTEEEERAKYKAFDDHPDDYHGHNGYE